jgi:carbon monoxide dehydrogenase subunit G
MKFHMDLTLPASREAIWPIFFDVARIARLIPGCEQVEEKEALVLYSAVMKQKIGPFKLEVPTEVRVENLVAPEKVRSRARGRDKYTGTTLDVVLDVALETAEGNGTRLTVDSEMQVAGRLAALGYPVVKKKTEEIFVEFEKRLRAELGVA